MFLVSCQESSTDPTEPDQQSPYELVTLQGVLTVVDGSTMQPGDFEVISSFTKKAVNQDGSFEVQSTKANFFQALFFNSEASGNSVYIGLYNPDNQKVTANDTSTALALTLFNPQLIFSSQAERDSYLNAVKANGKFNDLLAALGQAYQSDSEDALDYDTNPVIYQLVVQLMKEAMESLGSGQNLNKAGAVQGDPPTISDAAGANINFVNPRHVFYGAGIYPDAGSLKEVVSVNRVTSIYSFNFGWPPMVSSGPEETEYALGNGYFKIFLTKELDFTKLGQWDTPVGRATTMNTGQMIVYLVGLVMGEAPLGNLATFGNYFAITPGDAYALGLDIAQGDGTQFLVHFAKLLADNSEAVALWIWEEFQTNAAHQFIKSAAGIIKNVSFVLKLFGYANEQAPFVWDMVFAPREVTYYITQQNGSITSSLQNNPPEAEFSISPPAGIISTEFTFDASATSDDIDNFSALMFRWDWQSDGTWDTGWSNNYVQTHSYTESGSYTITLEVADSDGLVGVIAHKVSVGGGAGTATHVKLFRDVLPWSSNATVTMLESLGFTEGQGTDTYEIIASSEMGTIDLIPGEDLVIISNDQNQTFYDNYSQNQIRFTNFAYMGGSIFWEACDQGWSGGSMANAGIVLPGNISYDFDYDWYNYVTDQNLPLVAGLPNTMDHNYASHESFLNLPDGTIIYCVNEETEPTLIEFNLGGGWVLMSGQPLEHQYDHIYGNSDMENLLPRIVAYFTGKQYKAPLAKHLPTASQKASYLLK